MGRQENQVIGKSEPEARWQTAEQSSEGVMVSFLPSF